MSKQLTPIGRASSRSILARVLETPDLAAQIEALAPPLLASLIDRIGLEDAGELVAFATTEQLTHLFDRDLWASESIGDDETFDGARFLVWLHVMLEAGDAFVAERLVSLPEDLVTLAFHSQVLVLPMDDLTRTLEAGDDDARATEKALASCLGEEIDEYQIVSRHHEGWDDVLAALLALDRDHHDYVARLLARCSAMSAELVLEGDGLYEVLTSEEMLEGDVAGDREDRRAEAGHVSPSAATAFLKLARRRREDEETPLTEHDPMTRAYFRRLAREGHGENDRPATKKESTLVPMLRALAADEEVRPSHRLAAGSGEAHEIEQAADEELLLLRTLRELNDDAPNIAAARSEELAYLANVIAAGASFQGRRFRPAEAVRAAIAVVSLGLGLSVQSARKKSARAALEALRIHPADALFRLAWRALHEALAKPAAIFAECTLRAAASHASRQDAAVLTRSADRVRAAAESAPWTALDALDALDDLLVPGDLDALRGLMDACPHLRGALVSPSPASDSRHASSSSMRFITTPAEVEMAALYVEDRARRARAAPG